MEEPRGPTVQSLIRLAGGYTKGIRRVVDKNGIFFIAFMEYDGAFNSGAIYVAKSTDGGATFTKDSMKCLASNNSSFLDKPFMTVDLTNKSSANNLYVTWDDGPLTIFVSRIQRTTVRVLAHPCLQ